MEVSPKEVSSENQVKSEYWIVSVFKFIVKHYLILSAVPLILGGIHQLVKLGDIGRHYLRFFSATQLLIDGIILLIILIVVLTLSSIPLWFVLTYNHRVYVEHVPKFIEDKVTFEVKKNKGDYERLKLTNVVAVLLIIIGIIYNREALSELFKSIFNGSISQFDLTLSLAILFCFSIFTVIGNINVYYRKKGGVEQIDMISWIAYCCLGLFLSYHLAREKIQLFARLESIGNYQKYHNKLLEAYPNYTKTEILYFNDKFIFTEVSSTDDKTIIITKMDDFLEMND